MKKINNNPEKKFNYNEPKWTVPNHQFPKSQEWNPHDYAGIGARISIEKALQSFEGVNTSKLNELGVTVKDLVKYRKEIKAALYALIKEENGYDIRLRSGSIAYLGALKFDEATDLVAQIALNPKENAYVRGYAAEALLRIKGKSALPALEQLIHDPIENVREKAIRVLGAIGTKKHVAALKGIATKDTDPEIKFRAKAAIQLIETGKKLKRPTIKKEKERTYTTSIKGIVKPIGRHGKVKPQTTFGDQDVIGGMSLIANQELERRESEKPLMPIAYELLANAPKGMIRMVLRGNEVGNGLHSHSFGKVYRKHEHEVVLDLPQKNMPSIGRSLDLSLNADRYAYQDAHWLPEAPNSPVIYSIAVDESVIWAKDSFSLKIKFYAPSTERMAYIKMRIRMPKANWKEILLNLSAEELAAGEKIIPGFVAAIPGNIEISTALYTENGGASKFDTQLMALPPNPISMSVSPATTGTIGEGPAHYNSAENKFYCYANLQVSNGFPHSVTLGPNVSARVTDGGVEKDNFSFSIGTSTISANSTRTIGIWMRFGGGTFNVFKNFGDVTIRLTLQTSEGDVVDSHVWAAMAQVKLALNFVGNFSSTTRGQLQSVVDNEASAIYEQQNLFISESAQFLLPSSNSDFNTFRDIEMDDNKASDCTSGSDEADDLRDDWSSPNDSWLDVWCVETLSGPACAASVGGFSPVNGPTGKGGSNSGVIIKMSSANLATTGGRNLMGIIIAHEVAHFLGLNHDGNAANFMAANTGGSNTAITHAQYVDMTDHGFVTRFVV